MTHALTSEGHDAGEDGTGRGTPIVADVSCTLSGEMLSKMATGSNPIAGALIAFPQNLSATQCASAEEVLPVLQEKNPTAVCFQPRYFTRDNKTGGAPDDISPPVCAAESRSRGDAVTAVDFTERTRADGRNFESQDEVSYALTNPGSGGRTHSRQIATQSTVRRLTPTECSRLQGFPDTYLETEYANADEAHSAQILHELWETVGAQTSKEQEWGTRISIALLTPQILLSGVHVGWVSWKMATECANSRRQMEGKKDYTEDFLRGLRQAWQAGYSPFRRESFEQFARQFGCALSQLPLEEAQARKVLRSSELWAEAQAQWPLRYAFSEAKARTSTLGFSDSVRYRQLGNAVAVPCAEWIAKRLKLIARIDT